MLHGQEEKVYGESAYASATQADSLEGTKGRRLHQPASEQGHPTEDLDRLANRIKSKTRARIEHVFGVIKRLREFNKAPYRRLAKNGTRALIVLGLANIFLAREALRA